MDYPRFFRTALGSGQEPYPYQLRLASEPWPALLDAPTGMGKTAAVVLAWLYKRLQGDPSTPRRLVYCLPMRILVGQTWRSVSQWLENLTVAGVFPDGQTPEAHLLMGGDISLDWDLNAARETILIGTQDQLLSRALNRGYAMSRFRWPLHFAFLHNDCLWVMDEIQLMGVGLTTSAQLQGLRESMETFGNTRTLWMSATLDQGCLSTIDHRPPDEGWASMSLAAQERQAPPIRKRLEAVKRLEWTKTRWLGDDKTYLKALAEEILERHEQGELTLVVLNRVARAQTVYQYLLKHGRDIQNTALIHSRFRGPDRHAHETLFDTSGDRIIIATQVVEAGVDISARVLFTECAPWPSLVQRFGRLNRYGEYAEAVALVVPWPKPGELAEALLSEGKRLKAEDAAKKLESQAQPYSGRELFTAAALLGDMNGVSPHELGAVTYVAPDLILPVLRRKDILDLFDTTPDLTGNDLDVSRFIRDSEDNDVQVFWREFDKAPRAEMPPPAREELCAVPIGSFRSFLSKGHRAWRWDHLDGEWGIGRNVFPGMTLLLDTAQGGYDPLLGWTGISLHEDRVPVVPLDVEDASEALGDDPLTSNDAWISMSRHSSDVEKKLRALAGQLDLPSDLVEVMANAGRWHDLGKAHSVFQARLGLLEGYEDGIWAKSGARRQSEPARCPWPHRKFFRHELASALAWLQLAPENIPERDLIAYVIAAHHGKVRMAIRSFPGETQPKDIERPFACGVWQGDVLPAADLGDGVTTPETVLDLSPMSLGVGSLGRSWTERSIRLRDTWGPFRLAYFEALLRVADRQVSKMQGEPIER